MKSPADQAWELFERESRSLSRTAYREQLEELESQCEMARQALDDDGVDE